MDNSKFGLNNCEIKIQNEDGNYEPLAILDSVEIKSTSSEPENLYIPADKFQLNGTLKIYPKKYGDTYNQYLYFKHHKKKRIRKKYNFFRKLGYKSWMNWY